MCIILLLTALPLYAAENNDLAQDSDKFLLYLYTPTCGYCMKFNPVYQKISSKYASKCKFVKIDASTTEGYSLMQKFNARYVPFVLEVGNNGQTIQQIGTSCLLDYACMEREMNKFVN